MFGLRESPSPDRPSDPCRPLLPASAVCAARLSVGRWCRTCRSCCRATRPPPAAAVRIARATHPTRCRRRDNDRAQARSSTPSAISGGVSTTNTRTDAGMCARIGSSRSACATSAFAPESSRMYAHFRPGEMPVDRHQMHAEPIRSVRRFEERKVVAQQHRDRVVAFDAEFAQAARRAIRALEHLRNRQLAFAADDLAGLVAHGVVSARGRPAKYHFRIRNEKGNER